jgi:hypothetical protein
MPGMFLASAALGAGASLIGGGKAQSSADDASRRQEAMQQQDLAFRQQVYNDQKQLYGPLQQRLVAMANSDQPLNWGQISGQIANQYSDAVRQVNQGGGQGQYGGLKYDRLTKLGLSHATGRVSAYNQGLMNRLNLGLSVSGQNQMMGAASMYAQGMSQASQTYGQQAAMFGQGAANAYGAAGSAITNAGLSYAMYSAGKTGTTSDIRLKRNVEFLENKNDLKIYKFQYRWSDVVYVGVMAQDLLNTSYESAVSIDNGYYVVDYSKLGFEMKTYNEYSALVA